MDNLKIKKLKSLCDELSDFLIDCIVNEDWGSEKKVLLEIQSHTRIMGLGCIHLEQIKDR